MAAVALAFWSRSPNYAIAGLLVAMDWALSNYLTGLFGQKAVNYIAPMTFLFLVGFWYLRNNPVFNGRLIYSILYWLYWLYAAVYGWHLAMRFAFPNTWTASYHYALFAANGVFWLICLSLILFGLLKGVDNRIKGGLPTLLDRWIGKRKKKA